MLSFRCVAAAGSARNGPQIGRPAQCKRACAQTANTPHHALALAAQTIFMTAASPYRPTTTASLPNTPHLIPCRETRQERQLRTVVFLADSIPWWISPVGYVVFAILGITIIPVLYPPGG